MPAVEYRDISSTKQEENSEAIRERVEQARERQRARVHRDVKINCNARMGPRQIKQHCKLTDESQELIKNAMDGLPAEFREILTLRHQEELSYQEIGEILKIPVGTVMSRLARARAKLREYLASQMSQEK